MSQESQNLPKGIALVIAEWVVIGWKQPWSEWFLDGSIPCCNDQRPSKILGRTAWCWGCGSKVLRVEGVSGSQGQCLEQWGQWSFLPRRPQRLKLLPGSLSVNRSTQGQSERFWALTSSHASPIRNRLNETRDEDHHHKHRSELGLEASLPKCH